MYIPSVQCITPNKISKNSFEQNSLIQFGLRTISNTGLFWEFNAWMKSKQTKLYWKNQKWKLSKLWKKSKKPKKLDKKNSRQLRQLNQLSHCWFHSPQKWRLKGVVSRLSNMCLYLLWNLRNYLCDLLCVKQMCQSPQKLNLENC